MTITGTCKFCGQTRVVDIPDDTKEILIQEEANHQASLECSCRKGSDWRANMLIIEKCSDNIEMMFRENYPEIADILQDAKMLIHDGDIKKITCMTPEGATASMYKRGGSIEVKFSQKHETVMSADW